MKSRRSKATDIPKVVKDTVFKRDKGRCVICKSRYAMPNAHALISRNKGGLGVEKNVITLCLNCHHKYDQGTKEERERIGKQIKEYLYSIYGEIDLNEIRYKK